MNRLRTDSSRLQNTITGQQNNINGQENTLINLRNQSSRLTEELQEKQRRVVALDTRIASEGTTLQELNLYADYKPYLTDLGLDVRKVQSVRSVFTTLAAFNYDPARIISAINQVGNLQTAIQNLLSEIRGKQKELQNANDAKETARREIQDLQEKKKDEEKRVDQAKREADRKIAELQQNLNNQMKAADATMKLLAEYVENREKLRTWGVEL